ncbi:Clavaminate synthase-like protein [Hypoxylon trugodes]|uniref:Clavaminate synthase-like protein n=1 Tax=Hypoxylon trugodes TaxID=326681 RepID=UPI0021915F62|nr:Clavaminate synthase-like protein [Hypoxylon trugodes]KAI1391558.1 Clavaminate synthase-like protein [Hypoxylon trugodes]
MGSVTTTTGVSRSLLNSGSRHIRLTKHGLSRSLDRNFTTLRGVPFKTQLRCSLHPYNLRKLDSSGYDLDPRPKKLLGSANIPFNSKRGLTTQQTSEGQPEGTNSSKTDVPRAELLQDWEPVNSSPIGLIDPDRPVRYLNRHYLRDACECSHCVNPDSGQKKFSTCDVPVELPIEKVTKIADGGLEIVWKDDFLTRDNHVSQYSSDTIAYKRIPIPRHRPKLWDKRMLKKDRLTLDYDQWLAGKDEFLSGLRVLRTHGILFLRNVPPSEESVVSIANQIGNLQETFYGRTWDVRSKPNAENIAYTSSFLGLHQDLLYMQSPPRIQLLHCLENTCEGGESLFTDGLRAACLMKLGPERLYRSLLNRRLKYHYTKHSHHYEYQRPVIEENRHTGFQAFWSPPFQASVQTVCGKRQGGSVYNTWLEAATRFRQLLEDDMWMYEYKMQPGECVLFDNLRVLHGRKQFDTGSGSRWLKGAYIAHDVFISKIRVLAQQLKTSDTEHNIQTQTQNFDAHYDIWGEERAKGTLIQWGPVGTGGHKRAQGHERPMEAPGSTTFSDSS